MKEEFRPVGLDKGKMVVLLIKGAIGIGASAATAIVDKLVIKKIFHADNWDGVADLFNNTKES